MAAKRRGRTDRASLMEDLIPWISQGQTLREFCRQRRLHWSTIYDWMEEDEDLARRIARAREQGFDALAQEALAIADTPLEGVRVETKDGKDGPETKEIREDMLGHRKLQVETRLKLLAKWDPKRYGDKVQLGGDSTGVPVRVESVGPEPPKGRELVAYLQQIAASTAQILEDEELQ